MKRLMIVACLLFLIASALLLLTVRYRVDDLEELGMVRAGGPFAVLSFYWSGWSGRWAYALIVGLLKLLPEVMAGIYLVGILAVWSWSCWQLGREWGLLVLCVTLIAAPNIAESLYWQSGATVYALPLTLFCLMLVCIKKRVAWFIPALGAIFIAALGDTVGVAQIVVIPVLGYLLPAYRRAFGAMFAGAVIGFAIVQVAPGNAARAAYYPTPDIWRALPYALAATGAVFAYGLRQAPLAMAGLVALPFWIEKRTSRVSRTMTRKVLVIIIATVAFNFALMLAAFFATSGPLPDRARIVPLFGTLAAIAGGIVIVRGKPIDF